MHHEILCLADVALTQAPACRNVEAMETMFRRRLAVGVFGVVLTGCASMAQPSSSDVAFEEARAVDCDLVIDMVEELPDNYEEFGGFVALPTLNAEPLQVSERENGLLFSKFGLLVRSEMSGGVISVDRASSGTALLSYASGDDLDVAVSVSACSRPVQQEWAVFAGGIWAEEASCVLLDVIANDGASIDVARVPVGEPCS